MFRSIVLHLLEDLMRGLSGPLGIRIRRLYYSRRLKRCGVGLVVEPGVMIVRPEWISLGDHVWLDRQVTLIAGPPSQKENVLLKDDYLLTHLEPGTITIGTRCHIGIGSIIQGHGGVRIGDMFGTSPYVKIYSLSHDHRKTPMGTLAYDNYQPGYRQTPVEIDDNVWLGIDTVVIGHSIGRDTFVMAKSIVSRNIPPNSIAAGAPASKIAERFPRTNLGES